MPSFRETVGKSFDRLTCIEEIRKANNKKYCVCRCTCGNTITVAKNHLVSNHTRSCGCLRLEAITTHGASRVGLEHPLYHIWEGVHHRCNNPKATYYQYYGGKGVKVAKIWGKYEAFRDYMLALPNCPKNAQTPGAKLTLQIDRINNDGNYEPGNVRWATRVEQHNNKRSNTRHYINGKSMTLVEIARFHEVTYDALLGRLKAGYSIQEAVKGRKRRHSEPSVFRFSRRFALNRAFDLPFKI